MTAIKARWKYKSPSCCSIHKCTCSYCTQINNPTHNLQFTRWLLSLLSHSHHSWDPWDCEDMMQFPLYKQASVTMLSVRAKMAQIWLFCPYVTQKTVFHYILNSNFFFKPSPSPLLYVARPDMFLKVTKFWVVTQPVINWLSLIAKL